MDFQSMLRKVKQKQYKSKAEFKDDLELIWSNCFTYNTGDVCLLSVLFRAAALRAEHAHSFPSSSPRIFRLHYC